MIDPRTGECMHIAVLLPTSLQTPQCPTSSPCTPDQQLSVMALDYDELLLPVADDPQSRMLIYG